ncbi:MAG: hypothetical protein ACWA45_02555 [Flavobacteriales bacterium]
MLKNRYYLIAIVMLSFFSVFAQNRKLQRQTEQFFDTMGLRYVQPDFLENFDGSPYYSPKFLLGNVYINGELTASNLPMRYNIYGDEIQVKKNIEDDDTKIKALTKSPDIYVVIFNDKFIYLTKKGNLQQSGYYQELFNGNNISLYKKNQKKYIAAKKAKTSFEREIPAKFKDNIIYYIKKKNDVFVEIPSSKSKRLKTLVSISKNLKDYIKNNNIDISEEKGLIKVIKYCEVNRP